MNRNYIANELVQAAKEVTGVRVAAGDYYQFEIEEDSIDGHEMDDLARYVFSDDTDFGFDGWIVFANDKNELRDYARRAERKGAVVGRITKARRGLYPL